MTTSSRHGWRSWIGTGVIAVGAIACSEGGVILVGTGGGDPGGETGASGGAPAGTGGKPGVLGTGGTPSTPNSGGTCDTGGAAGTGGAPPATGGRGPFLIGGDGVGGYGFAILEACESCGWMQASAACQERVRPIPLFTTDQALYYKCLGAQSRYYACLEHSANVCVAGIPNECEGAMQVLLSGCECM